MITYLIKKPTLREYKTLRNVVDWNLEEKGITNERAKESLKKSPICACAYDRRKIVGMIRLSGDLSMYGYIQDTIVSPEYQGKEIGSNLLNKILENIKGKKGYLLGVCPSKISVNFYEKVGFIKRPEEPNGFMSLEIK